MTILANRFVKVFGDFTIGHFSSERFNFTFYPSCAHFIGQEIGSIKFNFLNVFLKRFHNIIIALSRDVSKSNNWP